MLFCSLVVNLLFSIIRTELYYTDFLGRKTECSLKRMAVCGDIYISYLFFNETQDTNIEYR